MTTANRLNHILMGSLLIAPAIALAPSVSAAESYILADSFDLIDAESDASADDAGPAIILSDDAHRIDLSRQLGWSLNDLNEQNSAYSGAGPAAETWAEGPADNRTAEQIQISNSMHLPREQSSHRTFGQQAGAIKTELLILTGYVALQSVPKLFKETQSFRFKDEGWFGLNTSNVGVDKLTHAANTYLISELLHYRLHRNTGGSHGDAVTAAVIAAGAMAINELSDAIEPNGGYSMQDITMNIAGAGFSVLRNTVPGLKEKLSLKVEVVPNKHIYSRQGKEHFAQQRYMFSLKGAGFEGLRNSPLRFLDAQLGYYASDFLLEDRAAGIIPKRHLFVGVGLNVGEILFSQSKSRIGRAAYSVLDYVQLPYTSLRYDTTGRFGN